MSQVLSFIIPAYNESATIETITRKVMGLELPKGFGKEIIIINDCSGDNTLEIINKIASENKIVKVLDNAANLGKSQTVRKGILESTGDYVVVQDADLEYEPADIVFLLENLLKHDCDVAYGNRFGKFNGVIYWKNFLGNIFLSSISNLFTIWHTRVAIPDMEVCYKLVKGPIFRDIAKNIQSTSNFGIEPEITAKLSKYHLNKKGDFLKFIILPVSYTPRSVEEGKKMKAFSDGFKALVEIFRFNLF